MRRKIWYFAVTLTILVAVCYLAVPAINARLSWYYVAGHYDTRNLLVTCEAGTPIFRTTGFGVKIELEEPILSPLEVYVACKTRDHLQSDGKFIKTGFFGQNSALTNVVDRADWCGSSRDLPAERVSQCRSAHFDAIDWLIAHGVNINAGELGTVLHTAIHNLDEEMFEFLISRGADPRFEPAGSSTYDDADEQLKALVDTEPRSAVELLELQLAMTDESEFPDVVASLQRMRTSANNAP